MKTDGWPQTAFPPGHLKVKHSSPAARRITSALPGASLPNGFALADITHNPRVQGMGIWVAAGDAEGWMQNWRVLFLRPASPTAARALPHLPGWLKDRHLSWRSPDRFLLPIWLEIPRENLPLRGLVPLALLRL